MSTKPQKSRLMMQIMLPWLRSTFQNILKINAVLLASVIVIGFGYGLYTGMIQDALAALQANIKAMRAEAEGEQILREMDEKAYRNWENTGRQIIVETRLKNEGFVLLDVIIDLYKAEMKNDNFVFFERIVRQWIEETNGPGKNWLHPKQMQQIRASPQYAQMVESQIDAKVWPQVEKYFSDGNSQLFDDSSLLRQGF